MSNDKYCIWCTHTHKVAVTLQGGKLQNLSKDEAEALFGLIHPYIQKTVKIRPMSEVWAVS